MLNGCSTSYTSSAIINIKYKSNRSSGDIIIIYCIFRSWTADASCSTQMDDACSTAVLDLVILMIISVVFIYKVLI